MALHTDSSNQADLQAMQTQQIPILTEMHESLDASAKEMHDSHVKLMKEIHDGLEAIKKAIREVSEQSQELFEKEEQRWRDYALSTGRKIWSS